MSKKKKVLIVGGGFGGVKAGLELAEDDNFDVTLLSDSTELRYYPTLYHTATGGRYANSSIPLARIFEGKAVRLVHEAAKSLDRQTKSIKTTDGQDYIYDILILALGTQSNYFGIPGLAEYSYSIKSQKEAERFKAHLHKQLVDEKHPDPHYVIVGAGPTGIELAGALPSYLREIVKKHNLPQPNLHIDLIEALPRLLPMMPKQTSRRVKIRLKRLGVKLYVGKAVQGQTADELTVSGKPIRSHTVIWTAGVTNHPFFAENKFVTMGRDKVGVDVYLQTERDIYILGDNANTPYSGLAQTALHDGTFVAKNLKRQAAGKKPKSYVAKEPITVIPAGPYWAAVIWGKINISGRLGWLVHQASFLVGFHDIEPWPKAAKQFMTEIGSQDSCPVCNAAIIK